MKSTIKTIAYIFASRERWQKFFAVLDNIREMSDSLDYFVVAKLDNDERKRYDRLDKYPEVIVKWGVSRSKIHAINRDNEEAERADIIVNMSDDMLFTRHGYDMLIREHCGPDDFVHFPDQFAGERVSTMSIMGVDYFKRTGKVYNDCYNSLFADEEATEVAKRLGRYKFVDERIYVHNHFFSSRNKHLMDNLYRRNNTWGADRIMFEKRKKINFGIEQI